jgi:serine/threonine protein kinase
VICVCVRALSHTPLSLSLLSLSLLSLTHSSPSLLSLPSSITHALALALSQYIAPEVIKGSGQSSAVDWWTFGMLIYVYVYVCMSIRI